MPAAVSVEKNLTLARRAAKKQDWLTAVNLNKAVLERFPGNRKAGKALASVRVEATDGLLRSAAEAQGKQDWASAIGHLTAAHYLAPEEASISKELAYCYLEQDFPLKALGLCDLLAASDPDAPDILILKGRALHKLGRADEAKDVLSSALKATPEDPVIHRLLGVVAQSEGNLSDAVQHFDNGLKASPTDISLLRHISIAKRDFAEDDPHVKMTRQALAKYGPDNPTSAFLHLAMFDMLHRSSEHDSAFPHLKKANELIAQQHPFDFRSEALVGALSKVLFPDPLPAAASPEPTKFIFVTGLPRTGTTLTERILARDERVQACGELPYVKKAVYEQLHDVKRLQKNVINSSHIKRIREHLLESFSEISDGRPIAVDKMPLNFRWIGYICAALPEARIVHMNRDPMAVAWSLYRQAFQGRGHDFIYTPEDIARFMVFHQDLMNHWRKVCGDRIFDLSYSDLVNDPESTTKALAAAVGLEWTEDWLSPEKASNHVRTASVAQVTKPVYRNSDEGWKTYKAHLGPLRNALQQTKLI